MADGVTFDVSGLVYMLNDLLQNLLPVVLYIQIFMAVIRMITGMVGQLGTALAPA